MDAGNNLPAETERAPGARESGAHEVPGSPGSHSLGLAGSPVRTGPSTPAVAGRNL